MGGSKDLAYNDMVDDWKYLTYSLPFTRGLACCFTRCPRDRRDLPTETQQNQATPTIQYDVSSLSFNSAEDPEWVYYGTSAMGIFNMVVL